MMKKKNMKKEMKTTFIMMISILKTFIQIKFLIIFLKKQQQEKKFQNKHKIYANLKKKEKKIKKEN